MRVNFKALFLFHGKLLPADLSASGRHLVRGTLSRDESGVGWGPTSLYAWRLCPVVGRALSLGHYTSREFRIWGDKFLFDLAIGLGRRPPVCFLDMHLLKGFTLLMGGEGGGARSLLKKIKVVNGQCVHLHIFVSNTVGVLKMKTCREIKK